MWSQLAKETRQSSVDKKVQWPGVLVFENFPEGIMISEYARIRILTLRVSWKYSRVGPLSLLFETITNTVGVPAIDVLIHCSFNRLI